MYRLSGVTSDQIQLDNPFKTQSQLGNYGGAELLWAPVVFSNDGTAIYYSGFNESTGRDNNQLSKMVLSTGEVTQEVDYNAESGLIYRSHALTIDSDGNLYWQLNYSVFQYNPLTGSNIVIAGALGQSGYVDSDIGTDARFSGLESHGLYTDNLNNIYVADLGIKAIRKIEHGTWKVSTIFQLDSDIGNQYIIGMFFKDDFLYFVQHFGQIDIKAYSVVSEQVYDIYTDDSHLEAANSTREITTIYIDPYYNIYLAARNPPNGTNGVSVIIPAADTAAAREAAYNAANP
jgi:hypothetical protein